MDVYKTHGAFSWSELMTTDPKAAAEFYGGLFGWAVKEMAMGGPEPYRVVEAAGSSVGGMMGMPPGAGPMPPNWCPYVTVANVDETLAKAAALGGKALMGPMDVPGVGRMGTIQDPQGAVLNVITYASP